MTPNLSLSLCLSSLVPCPISNRYRAPIRFHYCQKAHQTSHTINFPSGLVYTIKESSSLTDLNSEIFYMPHSKICCLRLSPWACSIPVGFYGASHILLVLLPHLISSTGYPTSQLPMLPWKRTWPNKKKHSKRKLRSRWMTTAVGWERSLISRMVRNRTVIFDSTVIIGYCDKCGSFNIDKQQYGKKFGYYDTSFNCPNCPTVSEYPIITASAFWVSASPLLRPVWN